MLKASIFDQFLVISQKRCKIGTLLWKANRKSYALYRMTLFPLTRTTPNHPTLPARRKRCAGNSHHCVSCICVSVCLSVCVTRRYCIKTAKPRITQTIPRDSPGTLVFWRQNSSVNDPPFLKFALKVTHSPFKHHNFDKYPLIAPQP